MAAVELSGGVVHVFEDRLGRGELLAVSEFFGGSAAVRRLVPHSLDAQAGAVAVAEGEVAIFNAGIDNADNDTLAGVRSGQLVAGVFVYIVYLGVFACIVVEQVHVVAQRDIFHALGAAGSLEESHRNGRSRIITVIVAQLYAELFELGEHPGMVNVDKSTHAVGRYGRCSLCVSPYPFLSGFLFCQEYFGVGSEYLTVGFRCKETCGQEYKIFYKSHFHGFIGYSAKVPL